MKRNRKANHDQGDLFADAEAPKQLTIDGRAEYARTLRNEATAAADAVAEKRRRAVLGHLYDGPREARR